MHHRAAKRLAAFYPPAWRKRFPDFVEVLALDLDEHLLATVLNVVRSAGMERLHSTGIASKDRVSSGFELIYATLLPFLALSVGMWSQLHVGLRSQTGAKSSILHSSDALVGLGAMFGAFCLCLSAVTLGVRGRPKRAQRLLRPAFVFVSSMVTLSLCGWMADRSGWYSPAAAALPSRGAGHSLTLWARAAIADITPAWIHPSIFGRMPAGELFATLSAPLLATTASLALVCLIRTVHVDGPRRVDAALALGVTCAMLLALASCIRWVGSSAAGQLAPGHTGLGVVGLLGLFSVAAVLGASRVVTGQRARRSLEEIVGSSAR